MSLYDDDHWHEDQRQQRAAHRFAELEARVAALDALVTRTLPPLLVRVAALEAGLDAVRGSFSPRQ